MTKACRGMSAAGALLLRAEVFGADDNGNSWNSMRLVICASSFVVLNRKVAIAPEWLRRRSTTLARTGPA